MGVAQEPRVKPSDPEKTLQVTLSCSKQAFNMMTRALLLLAVVALAAAGPMKLYEKTEAEKFQKVLVPVSSTVIPLDDLPVYKVGVGFGLATPAPGKFKPEGGTKLITIHSVKNKAKKPKESNAALIEEVTKEEYEKLTAQ